MTGERGAHGCQVILCPTAADRLGLAPGAGAAYRHWANFINPRGRSRGHLFDGRFAAVAVDDNHLMATVRYVALNPVRGSVNGAGVPGKLEQGSHEVSPPTGEPKSTSSGNISGVMRDEAAARIGRAGAACLHGSAWVVSRASPTRPYPFAST